MSARRLLVALWAIFMLVFGAGSIKAACTLSNPTASLGSSSSYDVRSGPFSRVSSAGGFNCSATLISLFSSNQARATLTTANNFKLKRAGTSDSITYAISADSAGTLPFTQGSTIDYMSTTNLALLNILSGANFNPSIFILPQSGSNVSAGTYSDVISIQWQWFVCHGIGIGGICILSESGTGTSQITVSMVVSADCRIVTQAVDFGSAPLVSQFGSVSKSFAVDCTKDSTYTVTLSAGSAGIAQPWRTMKDSAAHVLQYNLYRTDGVTIWDTTNPMAGATPGTGNTTPTQNYGFVAKINPAQTTPPAGHYSDLVSVIVSF